MLAGKEWVQSGLGEWTREKRSNEATRDKRKERCKEAMGCKELSLDKLSKSEGLKY